MSYRCLTLLTDYGYDGGFVGALHAVAFSIAPEVPVIDLDHSIPPQDVRLGGLRLQRMMRIVPPGVHVAVVDPGVGTARRPVAVATPERVFVGPDNGLLVSAAFECVQSAGELSAVVLDRKEFWLAPRSATFDGRDIFVPVGAHLAVGVPLAEVGSPIGLSELVAPRRPVVELSPDARVATVEVLQIDGFGNVQLSGDARTLAALRLEPGGYLRLEPDSGLLPVHARVGRAFGDVAVGQPVVLIDSDGHMALSINSGRADELLGARRWSVVRVFREPPPPPAPAAGRQS